MYDNCHDLRCATYNDLKIQSESVIMVLVEGLTGATQGENGLGPGLLPRPLRPFKSSEEHLEAMKEDLAEWLNALYIGLSVSAHDFMDKLETGVILCQHANKVHRFAQEFSFRARLSHQKSTDPPVSVPDRDVPCRENAKAGTFFARDNVHNFICWCRDLGILQVLLFETEDLILRKNERHVVLCLLEVARLGARLGMPAPMLVQMEQEIDRDIMRDKGEIPSEDQTDSTEIDSSHRYAMESVDPVLREDIEQGVANMTKCQARKDNSDTNNCDEKNRTNTKLQTSPSKNNAKNQQPEVPSKSLDEMVREMVKHCSCPSEFPMIKVAEGKYRIGDSKIIIYVRILRNHVMVRVGGGWDTLPHYLEKHDPCRCNEGHRVTTASRFLITQGDSPHMEVQYTRTPKQNNEDSPSTSSIRRKKVINATPPSIWPSTEQKPTPTEDSSSEVSDEGYRSQNEPILDTMSTLAPALGLIKKETEQKTGNKNIVCSQYKQSSPRRSMPRSHSTTSEPGENLFAKTASLSRMSAGRRSFNTTETPVMERRVLGKNTWNGRTSTKKSRPSLPTSFTRDSSMLKSSSLGNSPRSLSPTGLFEGSPSLLTLRRRRDSRTESPASRIPVPTYFH